MSVVLVAGQGLTVRDDVGNFLVFERWDGGKVTSWSEDSTGIETRSVMLSEDDRRCIAAFLLNGLS